MRNLISGMGVIPNKQTLCRSAKADIYYHYTSLDIMWKILENETIRATQATFSNDSEEIKMGLEFIKKVFRKNASEMTMEALDRYIFCLCKNGDKLSQWRAYCSVLGVSIGLAIDDFQNGEDVYYSCYVDGKKYCEIPLYPVYYLSDEKSLTNDWLQREDLKRELKKKFKKIEKYESNKLLLNQIILSVIPYIKHAGFYEEEEYRVLFSNEKSNDHKLIKYFDDDKTKVKKPYVDLVFTKNKNGENTEKNNEENKILSVNKKTKITFFYNCENDIYQFICKFLDSMDKNLYEINKVHENKENTMRIVLGYTSEEKQKQCFLELDEKINCNNGEKKQVVPIWCQGHLPVRKIIVSPSANQEQVISSIKHYCKYGQYWMKYIEIEGSKIPYRRPIINV